MHLYRHLTANHVTLKPMPFLREIAMEAYLAENPNILALDEDELTEVSVIEAEVPAPRRRKSQKNDGRIDLLAVYGASTVGVLELKHGELNESHLEQLEDYLEGTERIKNHLRGYLETTKPDFLGVLVGTSINSELRTKIEMGHKLCNRIPVAALTLARYKGDDGNVYVVADVYFQNAGRDTAKYRFEANVYGKGRLVHACIKKYVEDHPQMRFAALERAFPRGIKGGRLGCFDTVDNAQGILDAGGGRRYFLNPADLIQLADSTISVCSQWGIGNIGRFISRARKLGFVIRKVNS